MRFLSPRFLFVTLAGQLLLFPASFSLVGAQHAAPLTPGLVLAAQKNPKELKSVPRTVWNFDGGIVFATDGGAPGGACFRLSGRVTAPAFFNNLKRIDDTAGTHYVRGTETLTLFPDTVHIQFIIHDFPCSPQFEQASAPTVLTRSVMSSMHLHLYWKRGVELRPAENFKVERTAVAPVVPYAVQLADQLPQRYEWYYEMTVPSAGVPLTDDLVLILRAPDGKIAARVAARL